MKKSFKYPSTNQFRQAITNVRQMLTFSHYDEEERKPVYKTPDSYNVNYVGTVKIHGTNGSILWISEDEVFFQSKSRIVSIEEDNAGFAGSMNAKNLYVLLEKIKIICDTNGIEFKFPVEVAGEWAGRGVQKGVAISEVEPFFSVFRVGVGEKNNSLIWLSPKITQSVQDNSQRIYNISQFGEWIVTIDFDNASLIQNQLIDITLNVEKECPAAKYFGITGIGEGVVWTPVDSELAENSGTWFKVKGEKHSSSKVKTLAAVDVEKISSIKDFVEYSVTDSRLEQGEVEIGCDIKKTGDFVRWVIADVIKEEMDTLEANSLTVKDVGKYIGEKARKWYMNKV